MSLFLEMRLKVFNQGIRKNWKGHFKKKKLLLRRVKAATIPVYIIKLKFRNDSSFGICKT